VRNIILERAQLKIEIVVDIPGFDTKCLIEILSLQLKVIKVECWNAK